MVWNTFFHVCPFDREGGGDLSDLGNAHIEPTHFKKGLPFPKNIPFSSILGTFKGLLGWFGAFFCINLLGGVKACQDGLEHFFSTFVRLTEGGGLERFGQWPYRPNTFQKGAVLSQAMG